MFGLQCSNVSMFGGRRGYVAGARGTVKVDHREQRASQIYFQVAAHQREPSKGSSPRVCQREAPRASRQGPRLRIASPEMFPEAEMLPHLICSRPMFIGGANDEADQHGGA